MFRLAYAFIAMTLIIAVSNALVLFPINDWLTWGAFPYPLSLLVTELTNRRFGPQKAKEVVYLGFGVAIILSLWLATPKIALASSFAFLTSQLLDIKVFNKLRLLPWWQAPLFASCAASLVDACLFWNLAFWGENVPLLTWALGDTSIKLLIDVVLLAPFRLAAINSKS